MAESWTAEDVNDVIRKDDIATSLKVVTNDTTFDEQNGKQKDTTTNTGDTPKDTDTNTKAKPAAEMVRKTAAAKSMASKAKPEVPSPTTKPSSSATSTTPTAFKKVRLIAALSTSFFYDFLQPQPLSSSTSSSTATKPTTSGAAGASVPSRKPITSPTQNLVKPATSVARSSSATATASLSHSRRASLAPSVASSTGVAKQTPAPTSRPPSVSSGSKGPASHTPASPGPHRPTVVSPASSTDVGGASAAAVRPRASVSDGVLPKKTISARTSLSSTKLSTSSTAPGKATATIPEVNEEVQELKGKVKGLEEEIKDAKTLLAMVQAERDEKQERLKALEKSTSDLEEELKQTIARLESSNSEKESTGIELTCIREELKFALDAQSTQTDTLIMLQEQIKSVETELTAAKEALDAAREAHEKALDDYTSKGRDDLTKAQEALDASKAELASLVEAHSQLQNESDSHSKNLQFESEKSSALSAEIEALKRMKEEIESKLSESEVEALELKESLDKETDEKGKSLAHLTALEKDLEVAKEASQAAALAAEAKEEEHKASLANISNLEAQLTEALESRNALQSALMAKEEAHVLKIAEIRQMHEDVNLTTAEELRQIKADLEGQEAKYAKQLEEVRNKHTELLEEAFQNAKNEAGEAHAQELQTLRLQSQSTIEQLRQAHQASLDDMKAVHEEALQSEVQALEKQISTLNLDLKVTREDLAKAKAILEASASLESALRSQIEEKETELVAAKAAEAQNAEIDQLSKELANAKAELASRTEDFTSFKESFNQIVINHQTELEEVAKGHAEDTIKLKETHAEQQTLFKRDREDLASRISELEVELATLKAAATETATSAAPSTPRKDTNGAATVVTKEELQRMHEAHNLKLYELESVHAQAVQSLTEKLEATTLAAEEQRAHAERLQMELSFTENSAEDVEDELKQLKQEFEHFKAMHQTGDGTA